MLKPIEEERFEFVLYINNHIVCQRYIKVRDYNEEVVNSIELKELMDKITGMSIDRIGSFGIIPNFFKQKTREYLWDGYNPYADAVEKILDEQVKSIFDKVDNFQFEIKVDKKVIAKAEFSGNFFPPKVRYQVNIKEIIPQIVSEMRYFLALKKYTKKYGEITI